MILENSSLDYPLLISGECINLLGGKSHPNDIYMLDGARRLVAYILSEVDTIDVYLITLKK